MNIDKYSEIEYDDQPMNAVYNYNEDTREVLIRCPLFHIIGDYYFTNGNEELKENVKNLREILIAKKG